MTNNFPREITFNDIRKGDTIKMSYIDKDIHVSRAGVVHSQHYNGSWFSESGMVLASPMIENPLIELQHREAPKLPAEKGSVIRVKRFLYPYSTTEVTCDLLAFLDNDYEWIVVYDNANEYLSNEGILEWNPVNIKDEEF